MTQEQVAEKLGVSSSVYGDIERGENDPKLSKLQKIAKRETALKDKELAMQQREIENLKVQIAQLQEINTLLKKD